MNPRTLTRSAVDLSVRTALAPWTAVARFTRFGGDRTSPLEVAVGRIDAAVREFAGRALFDDELVQDAARRRAAADNRSVAIELHQEAEKREQEAEQRRQQREAQAEEVRERTEQVADQKREQAEQKASQRKQAVKKSANARKQAVSKAAAKKREQIAKAEREARLEELEETEEALDAEQRAIAEQKRAERLKSSAAATRAARR
jgi:DNA anti-recombination protein RmuC